MQYLSPAPAATSKIVEAIYRYVAGNKTKEECEIIIKEIFSKQFDELDEINSMYRSSLETRMQQEPSFKTYIESILG